LSQVKRLGNLMFRSAAAPSGLQWPWLNRVFAAWVAVMVALLLGVMTFAAVREMTAECRREQGYLLTEEGDRIALEDGSGFLLLEEKSLRCRFGVGDRP
jgi:hypothetical protein